MKCNKEQIYLRFYNFLSKTFYEILNTLHKLKKNIFEETEKGKNQGILSTHKNLSK